jgi:hypothetical protein
MHDAQIDNFEREVAAAAAATAFCRPVATTTNFTKF